MKVKEVARILEELAPLAFALPDDNPGLQIGNPEAEITGILVALEITPKVVRTAAAENINFICTHHPLLWHPLKKINTGQPPGNLLVEICRCSLHVYSAHTNLDVAPAGLGNYLGNLLGLTNQAVLEPTLNLKLYKLVVFTPKGYEEKVREAICAAGAGHLGNYDTCTFQAQGTGTFRPLVGASPFYGEEGKLEKAEEYRLETIVPETSLSSVLAAMRQAHPYEEIAYDLYLLQNQGPLLGFGSVGELPQAVPLATFATQIKETLGLEKVKVSGELKSLIQKVAVCPGAGGELWKKAWAKGAEVLVTGDLKYHQIQNARVHGLSTIDVGHHGSEKHVVTLLAEYLAAKLPQKIHLLTFEVPPPEVYF